MAKRQHLCGHSLAQTLSSEIEQLTLNGKIGAAEIEQVKICGNEGLNLSNIKHTGLNLSNKNSTSSWQICDKNCMGGGGV